MDNQQEAAQEQISEELIQYRLLDSNEDYKLSKIEKSGIKVEFTIQQIENEITYYEKKLTEIRAQGGLERAKIENILNFNPEIKEIEDKKLNAIAMYWEAKKLADVCESKSLEIDKAIESSKEEIKQITEKLGFAVPSTI